MIADRAVCRWRNRGSSDSVAACDLATVNSTGYYKMQSKPIAINGLGNWRWEFQSGNYDPAASPAAELYFAVGPDAGLLRIIRTLDGSVHAIDSGQR